MCSYLPTEWHDEERMAVMMGPMPSNGDVIAYNSRIIFWKAVLSKWAVTKSGLGFTMKDAEAAFQRGTQVPKCLPETFQHLLQQKEIVFCDEPVLYPAKSENWFNWGTRVLLSTPTKWALNTLQDNLFGKNLQSRVYVHSDVLKKRVTELLSTYWGLSKDELEFSPAEVTSVEDLYRSLKFDLPLSLDDLIIVLRSLANKNKALLIEHRGSLLVKFAKPGQKDSPQIADAELAEFDLNFTQRRLKERLKSIEKEITDLREEAKQLALLGSKVKALSVLRRKKRLEKSAENLYSTLENVSTSLDHLQESKLNVYVLKSFQAGVSALKSSMASTGSSDDVFNSMDELQDALDECRDIGDTLAFGIKSSEYKGDDELELELSQILTDPDSKNESSDIYLPEVPSANPSIIEAQTKKPEKLVLSHS